MLFQHVIKPNEVKFEKRIVFQTGSFVTFVSMGVEFALQTAQNFFNFKKGTVIKNDKP